MRRKVPLEREDNIPQTAKTIMQKLTEQMTKREKAYYEEETDFFDKLTSICVQLNPKSPKPENK